MIVAKRIHSGTINNFLLKDKDIVRAIGVARRNWRHWRPEFEGGGGALLSNPKRFDEFCREYYVFRTIRAGTRHDFRERLRRQIKKAVSNDGGRGLDTLEKELRPEFGTRGGANRMISILSKVAAFVKPERFLAWDRFARKGLNLVLGRPPSRSFATYAEYLAAVDLAWNGDLGRGIRRLTRVNSNHPVENATPFQRRVLDVCLIANRRTIQVTHSRSNSSTLPFTRAPGQARVPGREDQFLERVRLVAERSFLLDDPSGARDDEASRLGNARSAAKAGSAPMYLFTKRLNLPVVSWGLGHGSGAQSKDEHMLIEAAGPMKDLAGAEKGFADFLYAFAQG